MYKEKITISLEPELIVQIKQTQLQLAGCSNVSSLVEILLKNWLQQFRRVE